MNPLALLVAALGGAAGAVQARVNGALGGHLGSALLAALASFGTGAVLAAVVVVAVPGSRAALRRRPDPRLPWWGWVGGLSGAFYVTVAAAAAPVIGVALFTVGFVAGQTGGGLLVDRVGLGPGGRRPVTVRRLVGVGIAVLAVAVAELGRRGSAAGASALPLLVAAAGAGLGVAVQSALNGRIRQSTRDPLLPTLVNFTVGTSALGAVLAVVAVAGRLPPARDAGPWWLWTGGLLGVVLVTAATAVVRVLGTLLLGLGIVAGQLAGGVLLDVVAPAGTGRVGAGTLAGIGLTALAVVVAAGRPHRADGRPVVTAVPAPVVTAVPAPGGTAVPAPAAPRSGPGSGQRPPGGSMKP